MKRTIKKQIWMSKKEAENLKKKAKNACVNEATYIRMLVDGFIPRDMCAIRQYAQGRAPIMGYGMAKY